MSPFELAALVVGPALFWAVYHWYKDRHQPEPFRNLLLSYLAGVAAGYLGLHAYAALELIGLRFDAFALAEHNPLGLFLYAVLGIGLIEELVKFLPFWLLAMRFCHFDELVDGVIYSSFIALGFASYENYFHLQYLEPLEALGRAFASPMVHVMFSSIWGYACAAALLRKRSVLYAAVLSLSLASLAHGLYDFFMIGHGAGLRLAGAAVILLIWVWRLRLIRSLRVPKHR